MANGGEGVDFASPASQHVRAYLTRNTPLKPPPTFAVEANLDRHAGIYRRSASEPAARPLRGNPGPRSRVGGRRASRGQRERFLPHRRAQLPAVVATSRPAFLEHRGEVYRIGPFNAARKEPLWRVALIATVGVAIVGSILVSLLLTPVWILAAVRGRLANRGGAAVRLLPASALIAATLTFGLPIAALSSSGMTGVHRLATSAYARHLRGQLSRCPRPASGLSRAASEGHRAPLRAPDLHRGARAGGLRGGHRLDRNPHLDDVSLVRQPVEP
jgi:hypothetical protein